MISNIKENPELSILNHSCAHVLAQAVKRIYPEAKFWVGPVIEQGFYYDIDLGDVVIKEEDLKEIERVMKKITKEAKHIIKLSLTKEEALLMFASDSYKIDLINSFADNEKISAYKQAEFVDLCRGPHVANTSLVKHFKLLKVSGAYYKGDSKNKQLQRIYGIAFDTEERLLEYLNWLEAARERDHKKLGRELGLFMMSEYGSGFPFWLPNGMILRNILETFWHKIHTRRGYQFIKTPIMLEKSLWETSGHWDNYRENMYLSEIDEKTFVVKPMNCPGALLIYKNGFYSYKDFPLRLAELGIVHRHEASGALNGLFRVRSFTQDDAHIFITPEQLEAEIVEIIDFMDECYTVFGLTYSIELSTMPKNHIGDESIWRRSETILKDACKKASKDFRINEGDGAFYGPKLDFHVKDSLNRVWQCGTIQLDMNLPERFDITYVANDGTKQRPIMLHRVLFGSIERFIGILIEHYAGAFPLWISPLQVKIIPVLPDKHALYANLLASNLDSLGYRVQIDNRQEKLGYRLREAQIAKVPFQIIIGDNEVENNTYNVREYGTSESVSLNFEELKNKLSMKS